jgi:hypothetical protein
MKRLILVAALALIARASLFAAISAERGLVHVEPSEIARNIIDGRGFVYDQYGARYRAWKEPLYIYLLAAVTKLTGGTDAALLAFHSLAGTACALAMFFVARRVLRDASRAWLAACLVAVNPFLLYYDTHFVHPLSADSLLFLLTLAMILRALDDRAGGAARPAFLAGLVAGAALWQRATLLAAGAGAWTAAAVFAGRRSYLRAFAVWTATALLTFAPWIVRNWLVLGRPVVTTDFAHILWLGNNPHSNGTYGDAEGRRVIGHAPDLVRSLNGASELQHVSLFAGEVRRFVAEQPGRFAELVATRLLGFFWFTPNAGLRYEGWQAVLYGLAYSGLLGLGLAGLVSVLRNADPGQRAAAAALCGAVAGLAALHAVTALNLKHRVPLELLLSVFAADPLARALAFVRGDPTSRADRRAA